MRNSSYNGRLALATVCRCWPLWLCFFLAWALGLVLPLATLTSSSSVIGGSVNLALTTGWDLEYFASLVGCMIASLVSVLTVWEYLFKAPAAMFYGSAPISRQALFAVMFVAGLLPLLVIELVIGLVILWLAVILPAVAIDACLTWLGLTLGFTLVFYSIAVLSVQFAGRKSIATVFYLGICTGVYTLELIVEAIMSSLVPSVVFSTQVFLWASPLEALGVWCLVDGPNWLPLIVYCLVAVVMVVIALVLNRRRHLEVAGSSLALPGIAGAFKVAVGVLGAAFFGMVTLFLSLGSGADANTGHVPLFDALLIMAMMVVGGFLGVVLGEQSLKRGKHALRASWKQGLAVSMCGAVLVLGCYFDVLQLRTYVPDADNVAKVEVTSYERMTLEDPANIEDVIRVHEMLIDQYGQDMDSSHETSDCVSVLITYTMKDGEEISRTYDMFRYADGVGNEAFDMMEDVAATDEGIESWLGDSLNYKLKGYQVSFDYFDETGEWYSVNLDSREYADFVNNALKPDIYKHDAMRCFLSSFEETNDEVGTLFFGRDGERYLPVSIQRCPNIVEWFKDNKDIDLRLLINKYNQANVKYAEG
ncbi:MAG: hypothetical protein PUE49_01705 [Eggerthellales bacterium]|nr:hypothetical protein [Eggerthellales bacterium]